MKSRIIGRLGAVVAAFALVVGGTTTAGATTDNAAATLSPTAIVELQESADVTDTAVSSDIGVLAQGGFDRDHWWIKISKEEVITIGADVVCKAVFRGPLS